MNESPKMPEHWTDRLSDYLDDELTASERAALEAHLATCVTCADTLAEIERVVSVARHLEDPAPEVNLWPGIAERMRPRRAGWLSILTGGGPGALGRRFALSIPQLAAASFVLILLSGGGVWLALRDRTVTPTPVAGRITPEGSPAARRAPVTTPATAPAGTQASLAGFDQSRYDNTVAQLEQVLREHRSELDPATVRVLEQNLKIIDQATEQARRALLADPANPYLNGHLADQMKRKIRLLQMANDLVANNS